MKNLFKLMMASLMGLQVSCSASGNKSAENVDTFQTQSGKTVEIELIKHGSLRILFDGKEIEVDPVTEAVKPSTDYRLKPKADYIFVTHEHFDHLDRKAIRQLSKEGTQLILNERCHEQTGEGRVMRNGDVLQLADNFKVRAVPAYNTTPSHLKFHPKGRDNGFLLDLDGLIIYIGADTEPIPAMKELGEVDIAFLPCNQPFTMTPAQLREAVDMIHPKTVYPYHLGDTDFKQIEAALKDCGAEVRLRECMR